jgi:hypothetical protein
VDPGGALKPSPSNEEGEQEPPPNNEGDERDKKPPDSGRWWDYYYVRYFVGTIYAIPLIYILEQQFPQASDWISNRWIGSTVLVTAGLAYCYLASAPILVMHAVRTHVVWPAKSSRVVAVGLIGAIAILLGTASIMVFFPAWFGGRKEMLLAIPATLVVVLEIFGLSCVDLLGPPKNAANNAANNAAYDSVGARYRELAKARTNRRPYTATREYVESYKHLREHGNAMGIVLLETVLALALWSAVRQCGCQWDKAMMTGFLLLAAWVTPAIYAWFVGTWLEAKPDEWGLK